MDELVVLERRIQERLAAAQARHRESQQKLGREMIERERLTRQFEAVAGHLIDAVVRPRVRKLASLFSNAQVMNETTGHYCRCRFEDTPDYPASTRFEFAVSLQFATASILVTYCLEIEPVLFKFDRYGQLVIPLNAVEDQKVAEWVDDKLLSFADTYVQLQFVEQYQQENIVVDPVYGMHMNRADAGATCEHEGHQYYFCVDQCREQFIDDPTRYVRKSLF